MTYRLPWTFTVVVAAAIALTIFFGAWAVSADLEGRYEELVVTSQGAAPAVENQAAGTAEEEWWEKTLLFACPFH